MRNYYYYKDKKKNCFHVVTFFCIFLIFNIVWFQTYIFTLEKALKIIMSSWDSSFLAESTASFDICHLLLSSFD